MNELSEARGPSLLYAGFAGRERRQEPVSKRMSAKRMNEAVGAYFARCDGTRERVPQKGGGFSERQIPYTLYGLSAAVSLSPREVLAAAHGQGSAAGSVLMEGLIRVAAYIQE